MKVLTSLLLLASLVNGCMFIGLSEDVDRLNEAVTFTGKVDLPDMALSAERGSSAVNTVPIIVALVRPEDKNYVVQAYTVVYGNDRFFLTVPSGSYFLVAFEDSNQDFTWQNNERIGWLGSPDLVTTQAGSDYPDILIHLRNPAQARRELPELYIPGRAQSPVNLELAKPGQIVSKSAFKPELGAQGMWDPVKFHERGHSGIFFLEPYVENKIPVLFVHGLSGSGHDWLALLEPLDRERFQPWIVQYPSGLRLDLLSNSLTQYINELKAIYQFRDLKVVAHSMGGLVARGFINQQAASSNQTVTISTFVSISTPWLGHRAASRGVKRAPVAVPSWFDMVPGSPYLKTLHDQPLPEQLNYFLLFSHKGGRGGMFSPANSDGTVTLRSQLSQEAQAEAVKVIGFDEDHTSILSSTRVAEKLNELLADRSR